MRIARKRPSSVTQKITRVLLDILSDIQEMKRADWSSKIFVVIRGISGRYGRRGNSSNR